MVHSHRGCRTGNPYLAGNAVSASLGAMAQAWEAETTNLLGLAQELRLSGDQQEMYQQVLGEVVSRLCLCTED